MVSNELRFVERDGERILQQKHYLPIAIDPLVFDKDLNQEWPSEWRDVLTEKEQIQQKAEN